MTKIRIWNSDHLELFCLFRNWLLEFIWSLEFGDWNLIEHGKIIWNEAI
jgi:hypothetical protein